MATTIIFFSKHSLLPAQRAELLRIFGPDTRVVCDTQVFADAADIVDRFRNVHHGDEMLVVAPTTVVEALLREGLQPLRAVMVPVRRPTVPDLERQTCVTYRDGRRQWYSFERFDRVISIKWETVPLESTKCPCGALYSTHDQCECGGVVCGLELNELHCLVCGK